MKMEMQATVLVAPGKATTQQRHSFNDEVATGELDLQWRLLQLWGAFACSSLEIPIRDCGLNVFLGNKPFYKYGCGLKVCMLCMGFFFVLLSKPLCSGRFWLVLHVRGALCM
ncbi:hypothetical protein O6H91_10G059200 [Diphasiastrum complanatum]|uniref:Uncharacterized protein n=1 Tax=Diphasiastrum complanatum TaxID=34168 RepID=A0ACC2CHJ2_DIPCM|nr:hypothetical protein O6H91_10G059200 [Diphasiastrum complanatum]